MALSRTDRGNQSLAYASQSTNTLTSASFSPAAGSLLLVLYAELTDDSTPSLTMSTTLSGVGSWTQDGIVVDDGFGTYVLARFAWAVCGGSPGTGTVTCTRRAGTFNMGMGATFLEISGQDSSPARQSVENTNSDGETLALNFSSSPLASSMAFTVCIDDDNNATMAIPSGFTQIDSMVLFDQWTIKTAEDLASAAQNNSWTGLGAFRSAAQAIEIVESSGSPHIKRLGGIPFAGGTDLRRW